MGPEARLLRRDLVLRRGDHIRAIHAAGALQRSLLPLPLTARPGLRVASLYLPAWHLSGDYFDLLALDQGASGVLIADVAGHGPEAALFTAMLKGQLAARDPCVPDDAPDQILNSMNEIAFEVLRNTGRFVTAIYMTFAPDSGDLCFANAGHPSPLYLGSNSPARVLEGASVPLGLEQGIEYPRSQHSLQEGDRLLLVTDGVGGQRRPGSNEVFGKERVVALLERHRLVPIGDCLRLLARTLQAWSEGSPPSDDMCAVLLEVAAPSRSAGVAAPLRVDARGALGPSGSPHPLPRVGRAEQAGRTPEARGLQGPGLLDGAPSSAQLPAEP